MTCLSARNIAVALLLLGVNAVAAPTAPVVGRTQLGLYDLARDSQTVYDLNMTAAEDGTHLNLTRADDPSFALQLQLIACALPDGINNDEGLLRVQNTQLRGTDPLLLPALEFISASDLLSVNVPLPDGRHLLFNHDSTTLLIADRALLQNNGQPCPKR